MGTTDDRARDRADDRADDRPPLRREAARLAVGALLSFLATAYGAGAALAVLLGDAETGRDKVGDAVAAVPTLVEEWRDAQYVVENRDEIRAAVDYLEDNAPPQEELERQAAEGAATLRGIEETYDEVALAWDAVTSFPPRPGDAVDGVVAAFEGRPDLDAVRDLAATAEQVGPVVEQVEVLLPVYYGGVASVNDNLASDELPATLLTVAGALAAAFVVAHAIGFWARRGRPGLVARALQRLGARLFHGWYVRHLPYALGDPVHAAARERFRRDLLADPRSVLAAADLDRLAARLTPPDDQKSS